MAFTYREVKDLYDLLADAGATTQSLPEWSQQMNQVSGSDIYAEGLRDNILKRASVGIDRGLEAIPGLVSGSTEFGRSFGAAVGMGEVGAEIGATLPRMGLNFLPLLIPGVGPVAGAARLGGTALLSGMDTYTQTGSPAAGVLMGLTNAAMPGLANTTQQAILKAMGGRLVSGSVATGLDKAGLPIAVDAVSRYFPKTGGQSLAALIGGNVAASALGEVAGFGRDILTGQPLHNPLSPESLLGMTLGQLPFSAIDFAGRSSGLVKSPKVQADQLEAVIRQTEKGLTLKRIKEAFDAQTEIERVPVLTPEMRAETEEVQTRVLETLSNLSKRREEIKNDPAPDKIEELRRIQEREDQEIAGLVDRTGGVGLGTTSSDPLTAAKVQIIGEDPFFRDQPNGRGYHTITVSDNPANAGLTYADGTPILPGDRIRFPAGYQDPAVNRDASDPTFLLPRNKFTKVENRPLEKKDSVTGEITPELPVQTLALDLEQHTKNLKELDSLLIEASTATSYGETLDLLARTNMIRSVAGYPEIDLAALIKGAKKMNVKALIDETKTLQLAEQAAKADRLIEVQGEMEYEASLRTRALPKSQGGQDDQVAREVLQVYESLSESSGRRSDVATSGLFWQKAKELEEKGQLTAARMAAWKEGDVLQSGKGLKKDKSVIEAPILNHTFKPLEPEDAAFIQVMAIKTLELTAGTPHIDDAKLFKHLIMTGETAFRKEAVVQAAFDTGLAEDMADAKDIADEFIKAPHAIKWAQGIRGLLTQNDRPALPPRVAMAPREKDGTHISAGGGFVWGLAEYDEATGKLDGKHTIRKSGDMSVAALKSIGGRGKPLQDVELEMMQALDTAVGGGAFDGKGNVNIKTLQKVLRENPVVIESHEYGMEGKVSEAKAKVDELTHNWLENLELQERAEIQGYLTTGNEEYLTGSSKEDIANAKLLRKLRGEVLQEPPDSSPRATSYYSSISPFDTKKFPVVRVDVVLPRESFLSKEEAADYKRLRQKAADSSQGLDQVESAKLKMYEAATKKWTDDGLHENLPNTLGWAMVQFVPGKDGQTVMFVGEQQSRWGQSEQANKGIVQKSVKRLEDALKEEGNQNPERQAELQAALERERARAKETSHPLLPHQHVLVLKAAIAEAQKRGVTKMVVSDGETAMMTEMHDKAARNKYRFEKGTKIGDWAIIKTPKDGQEGVIYPYVSKEAAEDAQYTDLQTSSTQSESVVRQVTAEDLTPEISQSGGMRLHYDTTLQSAMRSLTGDKGEKVDMGGHKNAAGGAWRHDGTHGSEESARAQLAQLKQDEPKLVHVIQQDSERSWVVQTQTKGGSPVFRNPDGSSKSSVTGTSYDLTKAISNRSAQGGFTLGDKAMAPKYKFQPHAPNDSIEADVTRKVTGDGHTLIAFLESSIDAPTRALAADLKKNFPEALRLVTSSVTDSNASFAIRETGNRVRINLETGFLKSWSGYQEHVVLHELIHGLTLQQLGEASIDPKMITRLDTLRNSLIKALPSDLKRWYDKAIESDWFNRNLEDTTGKVWEELAPNSPARQILYGLINNDEFLAQGFSSKHFRSYMQNQKGKATKKTGFQMFTNWVRELLNLGEGMSETAFEQFMNTSYQLMQNGEYLASVQKFGESYFKGKSMPEKYGKIQTARGLGLVNESAEGLSKENIITSLGMSQGDGNQKLQRAMARFKEELEGEDKAFLHMVLTESKVNPDVLGMDSLIEHALSFDVDLTDTLAVLTPAASKYIFTKLRDHKDVLDFLEAAVKEKNKDLVNIQDPSKLRGPVRATLKAINKMLEAETYQTEMAEALSNLSAVEPGGFVGRIAKAPKEFDYIVGDVKEGINSTGSWIARFLEPMGQLARRIPEAAEVISKGFQLGPNARKMFNEAVKAFGVDASGQSINPDPTHESVKISQKVFSNPKLLDAANKWMYWSNKEGKDKVVMLTESHPEVAKVLSKLTPEERLAVHDVVAKQSRSIQALHAMTIEKMMEISAIHGAGVAGETGMKVRENLALSDTLLKALIDAQRPDRAVFAQSQIASVQQRMQPDAFMTLLKFQEGEAQKILAMKDHFNANPAWATAQRTERYLVRYRKNGKPFLDQASSLTEARDILAKKGGTETSIEDQWKGKDDEPFAFPNMTPEMALRMQQLEENQIQMLMDRNVLEPQDVDAFRKTSAVTQILREATAEQGLQGVTPPARLMSQGADQIPWLWNHITYAQRQSNYWSRALLRAQARTYLRDPELAGNEQLRKDLKTHFDNLLHPDPMLAQGMRKAVSVWFLGFNMATAMINASQPFVTHVAELTAMSGKPLDSYRRIMRAFAETNGRFLKGKEWATEEHQRFQNDAVHDGEVGIGKYDDDIAAQESIATNYKRAMMKNKTQSLGQHLATAAGGYSTASMWVFQQGERLNSRTALLASFDYYREQGLNYEEAKAKAYEFNRAVNFGGGRAQRPVGAFSGRGTFPRSVAMLGTSLQSYVWGTTFQIVRYLQRGSFRPNGLKPHEIHSARKAAVQMLGTQLLAAGTLGLPFVSSAIALLDKAFPDLELNKNLREMMASFFESDDENGKLLTDIAMTGVPSMLGWDMQSRLSMGNNLPGVSEVNGFQAENLMGPAGNMVKNFVGGVTGFAKGETGSSLKFLPPAVGKLVSVGQSFLSDGGEIRDYQGRPLEEPTRGENLGRVLGFQPKRLSDQNAASRILAQSTEVTNRRESQFRQELAEEALKRNFGTIRSRLLERSREDKSFDPVEAVRSIAKAAEELTFPRDLRREGSGRTMKARESLLASYSGVKVEQSREVDRLMMRKSVEESLGLRRDWNSEIQLATLMDQLRAQNPSATRLELKAAAQSALRRSQKGTQSLSLE